MVAEFKVQVTGVGENVWSENSLRFATHAEAEQYALNLASRWMGMDMARVVPSDTPVKAPVVLPDPTIVFNARRPS